MIPLSRIELDPDVLEGCLEAVARVAKSNRVILGPEVERFEQEFAEYCGVPRCVGVASGTDALELALRGVGVQGGGAVAVTANAGFYGSTAVLAIGASPIYIDVNPKRLTMEPAALRAELRSGTRLAAVIVTHLYGQLAEIVKIVEIASEFGVPVVEDCAQAHGASLQGKKAGSFGEVGCFSFYPTKNLGAIGDGGAVITANSEIADRCRRLRQYGWDKKYRVVDAGGMNSRLDEIQAAYLRAKLPYLDQWNGKRRSIAQQYLSAFSNLSMRIPPSVDRDYVAHLFVVRTTNRDSLREHLLNHRISTDIHYPIPDHRQPVIGDRYPDVHLENTERSCAEVLTLPCFPGMKTEEINAVIDAVTSWQNPCSR